VQGSAAQSDAEDESPLPELSIGEQVPVADLRILEKKTKPAPLYTEASLLAAMESAGRELADEAQREAMKASGLGTPATRAGIIELLIARRYVERQGKSLVPTAKGLEVYDIVHRMRIADVEMTGMWELALGKIALGEIRPVTFTSSIDIYTRQIVAELLAVQITRPEYVSCPCPKCHDGQVRLYPKVAKCSDPDCALLLFRNINGRTLTDEELLTILGGGRTPHLKFVSRKSGKPYLAALSLDEEYALKFEFQEKKGNQQNE
jgi:DNA topoisomerase-3